MNKLSEMSFADLKAALEYLEKQKSERIGDLNSQGLEIKGEKGLEEIEKLEFLIHTDLQKRLIKLKK